MQHAGAMIAFACGLPGLAAASTLTFNVWPNADPDSAIFCSLTLDHGRLIALQAKGLGMQNPRAVAWWRMTPTRRPFWAGCRPWSAGRCPRAIPTLRHGPSRRF